MSPRPRLSLALTLGMGLSWSASAGAQSITLNNNRDGIVRGPSYNPDYTQLHQFNRANCAANEQVLFQLIVRGGSAVQSYHIEAWIGTACDVAANRAGNAPSCRKVGSQNVNDQVVYVWLRDLMGPLTGGSVSGTGGTGGTGGTTGDEGTGGSAALGGTGGDVSAGGTLGTAANGGTVGIAANAGTISFAGMGGSFAGSVSAQVIGGTTATGDSTSDIVPSVEGEQPGSVCDGDSASPTPADRTIFFLLVNADNESPAGDTGAKWTFQYDMRGPQAPNNVSAGIGENVLVMKWKEADNVNTDLERYVFLCDPPPNDKPPTGEGSAGDGSEDLPSSSRCETSAFATGLVPSEATVLAHLCGDAQNISTTAEAGPLTNGVRYTIGIVARDRFYNPGPVSNLTCATPEPVTDFFEAYRAAGGKAGGGFCSIGRAPSHAFAALFVLGGLALVARRRATKRRSTENAT